MIYYLSEEQIEEIHALQIETYGGSVGCRNRGAISAAVARPAMTFGGEDLYLDISAKAAALMHSLVMNHPYVDGNKRVGAHAAMLFILMNGYQAAIAPQELEEVTMAIARGEIGAESLAIWFRQRVTREE